MPGTDVMLDCINAAGIRSGVVSNLRWSGEALTQRFNRLLPRNQFEFVISSSDYLVRKPNRLLFDVALQKAGLNPENVWYAGDNPKADIEGAAQVGIYPVWYNNDTDREGRVHAAGIVPQCEHLHIREWSEMAAIFGTTADECPLSLLFHSHQPRAAPRSTGLFCAKRFQPLVCTPI